MTLYSQAIFMFFTILVFHICISLLLVFTVILQSGRGADLGAAFGGMGQATYGRTPASFLTRFTTSLAVLFMATSLGLAFLSSDRLKSSLLEDDPSATAQQEEVLTSEEAPASEEGISHGEQEGESSPASPQKAE